jgi:hypothetical protein
VYARRIQKICRFRFNAACSIKVFGPCCQQEIVPAAHTRRDQFPKQRGACWRGVCASHTCWVKNQFFTSSLRLDVNRFFGGVKGVRSVPEKKLQSKNCGTSTALKLKGKSVMFQCSGFLAHRREGLWRPRKILQEHADAAFFKNRRHFSGSYRFQRNKRTLHTLYFLSLSTKLNNTNKNNNLHTTYPRRPRPPIVVFRPFQKTTFGTSNKNNHLAKTPKSPRC